MLRPLQEVWLLVPSISRFQWHPFTVAGGGQDGVLTLHVKRYGAFTKVGLWGGPGRAGCDVGCARLASHAWCTCLPAAPPWPSPCKLSAALSSSRAAQQGLYPSPSTFDKQELLNGLRRRRPTTVRVAGPIGCETTTDCQLLPSPHWAHYEVLVLFGGGVGVSAWTGVPWGRWAAVAAATAGRALLAAAQHSTAGHGPAQRGRTHLTRHALTPAIARLPRPQVTALLSILRAIAERRAAGQAAGLPRRVYCVWTARALGDFKSLDAPLLEAAA